MSINISGFPEFLPKQQISFDKLVARIKAQFELHGFVPLETAAVERVATLLAKGNDNEIYGLYRLAGDQHSKEKDLALRFDLTVPLARYVAQNYGMLTFPYRRYHIAPVWRGERPQAGRYRQFYQCDIDIIGDGDLPIAYDAECLSIIYSVLVSIGVKNFAIKLNNRFLLIGLLKSFDIEEKFIENVTRIIDKVDKISNAELQSELCSCGLGQSEKNSLLTFISQDLTNQGWISYLRTICTNEESLKGLSELLEVFSLLQKFNVPEEFLQISPTLARGLNYYTGTIAEIKLQDYPELGSICGGGRYENLAGTFSNKKLPGVGFSIGISRLIPKLIEAGVISSLSETTAMVLVTAQNSDLMPYYIKIANILRNAGINTEIYLAEKSLGGQMKYASKKGFKFAIIANKVEYSANQVIIRMLTTGEQSLISMDNLVEFILKLGS